MSWTGASGAALAISKQVLVELPDLFSVDVFDDEQIDGISHA